MRLTKKSDYALRALFTLVENYERGPVPTRLLASRNDIPQPFLEQILLAMKQMGWVESVAGKRGGYQLARNPERITLGMVVRHFDGLMAPIGCVSTNAYEPCTQESLCRFRRILLEVRNETARIMDRASLASVFRGRPVSRAEVFDESYMEGAGI